MNYSLTERVLLDIFKCNIKNLKTKNIHLYDYDVKVEYLIENNILYVFDFNAIKTESISHYFEKTISNFNIKGLKNIKLLHTLNKNEIFMLDIWIDNNGNIKKEREPNIIRYDSESMQKWSDLYLS